MKIDKIYFDMDIYAKRFNELTVDELYEIFKLRCDVFVVEQKCNDPEIDELDKTAIHVAAWKDGELKGYLRIILKDDKTVVFGRVVSRERRQGTGRKIMEFATDYAVREFGAEAIRIDAQTQAIPFYESVGFTVVSE